MQVKNFGQNIQLTPTSAYTPHNECQVLSILNRHRGQKVRCIGRLHSWSPVIEADDVLLDLRNLNDVQLGEESELKYVDVGAGCQIKRLLHELQKRRNWTLPSVGFITEQSVAGAISTGTHGSGRHSLSHYVMSVRIARYDSNSNSAIVEEITSGDELRAARCSIGCLGVILSVRMQCRAVYAVEEHFREHERIEGVLEAEVDYPLQQFYYVPWRWTYVAQHRRESVARQSTLMKIYHWYRYLVFDWGMHFLILLSVRFIRSGLLVRAIFRWILPNCVLRNWRVVGPSALQLVMEHELFRHVEIELFVQRRQLPEAMKFLKSALIAVAKKSVPLEPLFQSQLTEMKLSDELMQLRGRYCHHYPICVRKILPDDTLISMACNNTRSNANDTNRSAANEPLANEPLANEPWYSITLTNYQVGKAREPFDLLTSFLARSMAQLFAARPHWGKLCPLSVAELRQLYPAFESFKNIRELLDPHHAFSNQWTERLLEHSCDL